MALSWKPFAKKPEPTRGHVRLHASTSGAITGLEVKSALLPEEVHPALHEALRGLEGAWAKAREGRLERHLRAVHKKGGMLDRLRGRMTQREAAARAEVAGEVFFGTHGPVTVAVDGTFAYVELRLHGQPAIEEATGHLPRALEAACKACEVRWEEKILEAGDSDEEALEQDTSDDEKGV